MSDPTTTEAAVPPAGDLVALLDQERAAFLEQVARVPRALHARRLAPGRWTVAEIVEHVTRVDVGVGRMLGLRGAQPRKAPPAELAAAALTPERASMVRDRSRRVDAPERVRPTGALSPDEALEQLDGARAALKAAFAAADPAVLDAAVHPHPLLGPVTLRGWVALAAHHDARHADQVAELADDLEDLAADEAAGLADEAPPA